MGLRVYSQQLLVEFQMYQVSKILYSNNESVLKADFTSSKIVVEIKLVNLSVT